MSIHDVEGKSTFSHQLPTRRHQCDIIDTKSHNVTLNSLLDHGPEGSAPGDPDDSAGVENFLLVVWRSDETKINHFVKSVMPDDRDMLSLRPRLR